METNANGTYFQEGDHVRIKRTGKTGRINATDGGVVYVFMDETDETRLFPAYVDEDASIELVTPEQHGLIRKVADRVSQIDAGRGDEGVQSERDHTFLA
jgi:hypothetical protein